MVLAIKSHTTKQKQRLRKKRDSNIRRSRLAGDGTGPFAGLSGLGGTGGACTEIQDLRDLKNCPNLSYKTKKIRDFKKIDASYSR